MKVQIDDQEYEVIWVHYHPAWLRKEIMKLKLDKAKLNSEHLSAVLSRTSQIHKGGGGGEGTAVLRGFTDCYIKELIPTYPQTEGESETVKHTLAQASAYCSWTDQFNYDIARKLSLTRALEKVWPGTWRYPSAAGQTNQKAIRRMFWDAYFRRAAVRLPTPAAERRGRNKWRIRPATGPSWLSGFVERCIVVSTKRKGQKGGTF